MKNKRLEALLEEILKAKAEEHTPEVENQDVIAEPKVEIEAEGGEPTEERVESHEVEKEDVHPEEQAAEEIQEVVTEAEESVEEEKIKDSEMSYKDKFEMLMKEFGVEKITELSDEKKKEFFNKLDDIHVSDEEEKAGDESLDESYTEDELKELFEALELDTHKYTFEYLAEELGFVQVGQEEEVGAPEVEEVKEEEPSEEEHSEEEQNDPSEYDEEGSMAKSQLKVIADAAAELHNMLDDKANLPEWVQSKITLAKEYIDTARDYLKSEKTEGEIEVEIEQPEEEKAPEEQLQERYVLKRHVGRPSKKEKALEAKGSSEINGKGEVVYTKGGK